MQRSRVEGEGVNPGRHHNRGRPEGRTLVGAQSKQLDPTLSPTEFRQVHAAVTPAIVDRVEAVRDGELVQPYLTQHLCGLYENIRQYINIHTHRYCKVGLIETKETIITLPGD